VLCWCCGRAERGGRLGGRAVVRRRQARAAGSTGKPGGRSSEQPLRRREIVQQRRRGGGAPPYGGEHQNAILGAHLKVVWRGFLLREVGAELPWHGQQDRRPHSPHRHAGAEGVLAARSSEAMPRGQRAQSSAREARVGWAWDAGELRAAGQAHQEGVPGAGRAGPAVVVPRPPPPFQQALSRAGMHAAGGGAGVGRTCPRSSASPSSRAVPAAAASRTPQRGLRPPTHTLRRWEPAAEQAQGQFVAYFGLIHSGRAPHTMPSSLGANKNTEVHAARAGRLACACWARAG
jgi:hypothetical protein